MKLINRVGVALICCTCLLTVNAEQQTDASLWQQMQNQVEFQKKIVDELKADNKELQDRLRVQEYSLLEVQRKSIDWWISLIGALAGAMAVMFGALPLLISYKEREAIKEKFAEAEKLIERMQGHAEKAHDITVSMENLRNFQSGKIETPQEKRQIAEELKDVQKSPLLSDKDRLRALAISASQTDSPSLQQARRAYELWNALTLLDGNDQNARFNAGYWAQELYEKSEVEKKDQWLQQLCEHYAELPFSPAAFYNWGCALQKEAQTMVESNLTEARKLWAEAKGKYDQALSFKPDMQAAACNWGNALQNEAQALAKTDLPEARRLWAQAGSRYKQALSIEPNMHEAMNNWGSALNDEAQALSKSDLAMARRLWNEARAKYEQALLINPGKHEAANNWGNSLQKEAQAVVRSNLTEARELWGKAGKKYEQALRIDPNKYEAANNWGTALQNEAQAMVKVDLVYARRLWAQAGEKYEQAINMQPNKFEAINNLGIALQNEAQAIAEGELREAQRLWSQSVEKYKQALSVKPDKHEALNNWGVALSSEAQALAGSDLLEARRLWSEARAVYEKLLNVRPGMHEAADNMAATLLRESQALKKSGEVQLGNDLLLKSIKILESYSEKNPETTSHLAYNLACGYALIGRVQESVDQLEVSRLAEALTDDWTNDEDFSAIRQSSEYKQWVQAHFPELSY